MNLLIDIEGMIIKNTQNNYDKKILVIGTEISFMFYNEIEILECRSTLLKYDLRKYPPDYWLSSYKYLKLHFPDSFPKGEFSHIGEDPVIIQKYLLDKIKKYNVTICAKGINMELQFLFGDLIEFHKSIKSNDISYNLNDLGNLVNKNNKRFPKYDDVENSDRFTCQ
jgi:hypothetical protein